MITSNLSSENTKPPSPSRPARNEKPDSKKNAQSPNLHRPRSRDPRLDHKLWGQAAFRPERGQAGGSSARGHLQAGQRTYGLPVAAKRVRFPVLRRQDPLHQRGCDYFPDAVQIVAFYHASEHLTLLVQALLGSHDKGAINRRLRHWKKILSFRCIAASRRLDDFWKYRRICLSAQNQPFAFAA